MALMHATKTRNKTVWSYDLTPTHIQRRLLHGVFSRPYWSTDLLYDISRITTPSFLRKQHPRLTAWEEYLKNYYWSYLWLYVESYTSNALVWCDSLLFLIPSVVIDDDEKTNELNEPSSVFDLHKFIPIWSAVFVFFSCIVFGLDGMCQTFLLFYFFQFHLSYVLFIILSRISAIRAIWATYANELADSYAEV